MGNTRLLVRLILRRLASGYRFRFGIPNIRPHIDRFCISQVDIHLPLTKLSCHTAWRMWVDLIDYASPFRHLDVLLPTNLRR